MNLAIQHNAHYRRWFALPAAVLLVMFSWMSSLSLVASLICLLLAQVCIFITIWQRPVAAVVQGMGFTKGKFHAGWGILFLVIAVVFALLYRKGMHQPLLPAGIGAFAITAMMIGAAEELVYRGYFTWQWRIHGKVLVVILTALAHTCYKLTLFISTPDTDLVFLFGWTFIVGLLLGSIRVLLKSIYPCLIFHCAFDLLVYGDRLSAPWWVW